ncbi:acyl-CoA dehydrogenase family protein [Chelativorans sp. AA-79]|uniref:acyl-CoA dehydrogenase family protein n=1 Tax=Chelativorans sp. AA-79 TaxID=3028735 RepID=UPI0023F63BF4|nr:acyl-CoA dehydrogenase family protein [Chelativorans sp. AA-79]WEX08712.1 acyl-CoA/acyl-ACP dehydrogenase [Chelativorans sp. AA-79]
MQAEEDWAENVRMIRESARAVVPNDGSLARIRALRFTSPGFDRSVFALMAEMGWLSLRLPEDSGGLGLGMREYCALAQEVGSGLVPEPLIGAALACRLVQANPMDDAVAGAMVCLAAWQDEANSLEWRDGANIRGGRVSGRKHFVPYAAGADAFAVVTPDGVALLRRDAAGLSLSLVPMQDGSEMGTLAMDGCLPLAILPAKEVDEAIDEAALATASYLLGMAERALQMTMDYLRTRRQFDRPIGSFQALQHRATDMKIQLELTRASVEAAAAAIDGGAEGATRSAAVSRAKCRAGETAFLVAREAIQMHGAIGFTDEYDVGLFARKAMVLGNLYGSPALHRRRFANLTAEAA